MEKTNKAMARAKTIVTAGTIGLVLVYRCYNVACRMLGLDRP